jgi:broad specificity phosphatase PhoE
MESTPTSNNKNFPQIYLIRHAESNINVFRDKIKREGIDHKVTDEVRDADLSVKGLNQTEVARLKMENKNIKLIFTSPMLRTLKTTHKIFSNHKNKPKVVVLPFLREAFFGSHDIPRELKHNLDEFSHYDFSEILSNNPDYISFNEDFWILKDLTHSDEKWKNLINNIFQDSNEKFNKYSYSEIKEKLITHLESNKDKYTESKLELLHRCKRLKNYLNNKIEEMRKSEDNHLLDGEIAIVSHAYFLSTFIAKEICEDGIVKNRRRIENCEIIEYNFSDSDDNKSLSKF